MTLSNKGNHMCHLYVNHLCSTTHTHTLSMTLKDYQVPFAFVLQNGRVDGLRLYKKTASILLKSSAPAVSLNGLYGK